MDTTTLNAEFLTKIDVLKFRIDFIQRNGLEQYPINRLDEITIDHEPHILSDSITNIKHSIYDQYGNLLQRVVPNRYSLIKLYDQHNVCYCSVITSLSENVLATYDCKGNMITRKDSNGYSYTKTYDANGNELTYVNSRGDSYSKTYDESGNPLTYVNNLNGFSWTKTYDENGNEVAHHTSNGFWRIQTYDERRNQLTLTDSCGYTWTKTYDERNNLLTYADSNGYTCTKTYCERGNELTQTDSKGYSRNLVYEYWPTGQLKSITSTKGYVGKVLKPTCILEIPLI